MIFLLKPADISSILPKKELILAETLLNAKLVSIKHLLTTRNVPSIDAISQNGIIEVLCAFMYNSRNPKIQPITISVSPEMTSIEILNDPMVQLLSCVFNDIRVVLKGNDIINLWIKGLSDEAIEAFEILQDKQLIDLCLRTLLHKETEDFPILTSKTSKAYRIENSNCFSGEEIVNVILSNKLFMYLITQCVLNDNFYSIPLPGWKKEEVENEPYFNDLSNIFKNVYLIGSGETWVSAYLIISQPFDSIVHCLV